MKKLQAKSTRTIYGNIKRGNYLRDPMKTLFTRRTVKFALSTKDTIMGMTILDEHSEEQNWSGC